MSAPNGGYAYAEQVGPTAVGRTVLAHLAERHRHSTAADWSRRVDAGEVELDGKVAAVADRLRAGQRLVWHRPPWHEPAAPLDFAVLHADADVLVVAKPRGLPTMPAGGFFTHTLQWQVQRRYPDAVPAHRLGRGTSGLVVFARSTRARRSLPAAWQAGTVERVYRGLVQGRPQDDELVMTTPIAPVPHALLGSVHAAHPEGKPARSTVRVLRRGDDASLVEIAIATGRPDQIRIHLAAAGHPLVGDAFYAVGGVPHAASRALPGDGGYRLHATRLGFPHPAGSGRWVVECPPPAELR
ncbi:MAG: RluA family pseudouridine synthase [Candidatus Binatia bacterium]